MIDHRKEFIIRWTEDADGYEMQPQPDLDSHCTAKGWTYDHANASCETEIASITVGLTA